MSFLVPLSVAELIISAERRVSLSEHFITMRKWLSSRPAIYFLSFIHRAAWLIFFTFWFTL